LSIQKAIAVGERDGHTESEREMATQGARERGEQGTGTIGKSSLKYAHPETDARNGNSVEILQDSLIVFDTLKRRGISNGCF